MSEFADIEEAIRVICATTVPGSNAQVGFKHPESVDAGDWPFIMVYQPEESQDEPRFGMARTETTHIIAEIRHPDERDQLRIDLDQIRDALLADNTLGGLVGTLWCPERAVDDGMQGRVGGLVRVTTETWK